jgi:uncharacterized membrane-anchored protein
LNKLILPGFFVMVLIQLYVPVSMILKNETVLTEGKDFKFRTAPVDPNDPFRGKYITLSFDANSFKVPDATGWNQGDEVYVSLTEDEKGFAQIQSVTKEKPIDNEDFVTASVGYVVEDTMSWVSIDYPFTRFYMEERKAQPAGDAYREAARDTAQITYALVRVKKGDAVVEDVLINGVPIREVAKAQMESDSLSN